MVFVAVLDHRHLELARQHHDRERRQHGQGKPVLVAMCPRRDDSGLSIPRRLGLVEQVGKAVIQAEGDEQADRQKGHQLDDRLEGDGRHHALVTLTGIEVPGAEQDGEGRQQQGHVEGRVLQIGTVSTTAAACDLRIALQDRETVRDRLQLQRDVGHHAEHGDDGHEAAEQLALAVARRDEVGDRGDALGLADPHHLQQQRTPQGGNQGRTEIDRQEADPSRRRRGRRCRRRSRRCSTPPATAHRP